MWPCKKKDAEQEPLKPPVEVGQRFRYLGIEMICSRDWKFGYEFPVVTADYVNRHGDLMKAIFFPTDWPALEAELGRQSEKAKKGR